MALALTAERGITVPVVTFDPSVKSDRERAKEEILKAEIVEFVSPMFAEILNRLDRIDQRLDRIEVRLK